MTKNPLQDYFHGVKINQDQISLASRFDGLRFHYYRGQGHLFRYIINRVRWFFYPRFRKLTDYPEHVDIELSAACNMKCPMCYTITDDFKKEVKRINMPWEMIKRILDECAKGKVFSIRLSWRGESTLNKHFVETVKYAKQIGIKEVSTLTNALLLTPEMFAELVDAGIDWITVSVDGTGETYDSIRKPAKFVDLIKKLKRFKEIKEEKGTKKPVIKVQTVWPAIENNPQEYFSVFSPLVDQVSANQLVDYLQKDESVPFVSDFECPVLYQRLTIGSDGKVLMCYNDEFGKHVYGDMSKGDTLYNVWHGVQMTQARKRHKDHVGVNTYHACSRCFLPREYEQHKAVTIGGRKVVVDKLKGREQTVGA